MRNIIFAVVLSVLFANLGFAQEYEFKQVFKKAKFDRPIYLCPLPDGSNRLVIIEQAGRVLLIENNPEAAEFTVAYDDRDDVFSPANGGFNEEGLLGIAFHPKFSENRQVFLHYSVAKPRGNIISRFTMDESFTKIDHASEEVIMQIEQPFFNHNGGSITFGPDGYLYIALGDGGSANDPQGHGQNLKTLLASILRIDVDNKADGKNYAIPADNPFIDTKGARPEIFAYGLRNVWRMSFDRKTGTLWAGDVGQNLWEEIVIVEKGGNYGWNWVEGNHDFQPPANKAKMKDLVPPIVEYDHNLGKSVTGGYVYRGKAMPKMDGAYIYGDYQTGIIWTLRYDEDAKTLTQEPKVETVIPEISSFGEDHDGEIYVISLQGRIYKWQPKG